MDARDVRSSALSVQVSDRTADTAPAASMSSTASHHPLRVIWTGVTGGMRVSHIAKAGEGAGQAEAADVMSCAGDVVQPQSATALTTMKQDLVILQSPNFLLS